MRKIRAFLSPGQTSSNRHRPTKLYCPTLDVSAFHPSWVLLLWLVSLGTTSGTRPHRCTPIVFGFPGASRYSHSSSKHRYSHSHTTHRHSSSHCCTRDRPHGLMGNSTDMQRYSYYSQVKRDSSVSAHSKQHLRQQNSTGRHYPENSKKNSTGLRRCCHILVLSLRSRFGALRLPLTPPRLSPYTPSRLPPERVCRGRPGASR